MNEHVIPIVPDAETVRQFLEIVHEVAGAAFLGVADPGVLQLSRVHPTDEKLIVVGRFPIGAIDAMTQAALAEASAGHNVYVEGRTVRRDLRGNIRGAASDTIGVFALVVDADADKGKDAEMGDLEPSLSVESSPGNRHHWLFLDRAVPAAEAQVIGAALRKAVGGDTDTGNPAQPYRVAGTPNFPGAKKRGRGRIASPTSIVTEGRSYSAGALRDALAAVVPAPFEDQHERPSSASTDRPDRDAAELLASLSGKRRDDLAATGIGDRSAHFLKVTGWLKGDGFSEGEAIALWSAFPTGAGAEKYGSRLAREVGRVWQKTSDDPDAAAEGAAIAERMATNGNASSSQLPPTESGAGASPIDLWRKSEPPPFPTGLLPQVIEEFARVRGDMIGADPSGLAVAALVTCAALISDRIRLRMKRHDDWTEPARLWAALIGMPSTKKSPIINAAVKPLFAIDAIMASANREAIVEYEELKKAGEKPRRPRTPRLRIEDVSIEAAQEILADSPNGILAFQDELSGWFGAMERYSGQKGGQKDRAFWLQSYNGGTHDVARIGRGHVHIENLSVCLLGGIQPDLIRKLAGDTYDDGLLQRMIPIVLRSATMGKDEPMPNVAAQYAWVAERLHKMQRPFVGGHGDLSGSLEVDLAFDDEGQEVWREVEKRHHDLAGLEIVNRKLASAVGKYNGIFGRLCVTFHCIENAECERPPRVIPGELARRVADFLHRFLFPHAIAFYGEIIGMADDQDMLTGVAGFLLAHPELTEITFRNFARGSSMMRRCKDAKAVEAILDRLDAFGWLDRKPTERNQTSARWAVVPAIHVRFADRAKSEAARRSRIRTLAATYADAAE